MAGNGDSGISRGAVSRAMALHQMRNALAEEYFKDKGISSVVPTPFDKYDSKVWLHTYHNPQSGGLVATEIARVPDGLDEYMAKHPNCEYSHDSHKCAVYAKERRMCIDLADMGHVMEHRTDKGKKHGDTYDILFDGKKADLKSIGSWKRIKDHTRKAIREQGAEYVILRLENHDENMRIGLCSAKRHYPEARILYYYVDEKVLREHTDTH